MDRETIIVPKGLMQALHRYLGTKPFAEVRQFIEGLEACELAPAPSEQGATFSPQEQIDA
jgi:hypothetical protein